MNVIKNLLWKLKWVKILISPFKPPKPKFYFGKIRVGTPYFLPRKWVKSTTKKGYKEAVPCTWFKISLVALGWKDKYGPRHEWNPMLSIVLLKRQFVISFVMDDRAWESWLYYKYYTNKELSVLERLVICQEEFPNVWSDGDGNKTDWFKKSLKKKYTPVSTLLNGR